MKPRPPDFEDDQLQLEGWYDASPGRPVSAWGTIGGCAFLFDTNLDGWRIRVAKNPNATPGIVEDETIVLDGTFGVTEREAESMSMDEVERILRGVARDLINTQR